MNNELTFTAELQRVEIDLYNFRDNFKNVSDLVDIDNTQTATVNFHVEIDARNWGVKDIDIFCDKVTATIDWEVYYDELTEEDKAALILAGGTEGRELIFGQIEIDTAAPGSTWEIVCEMEAKSTITPNMLEIDFSTKKITISNN